MLSLIPGMKHGHAAGWNPPESYAFAESIVKEGKPWCQQTEAILKDNTAEVSFVSSKPLERAVLISTADVGFTGSRKWIETPATIEKQGNEWKIKAGLPTSSTGWFVNVQSGDLTASSDYQELQLP